MKEENKREIRWKKPAAFFAAAALAVSGGAAQTPWVQNAACVTVRAAEAVDDSSFGLSFQSDGESIEPAVHTGMDGIDRYALMSTKTYLLKPSGTITKGETTYNASVLTGYTYTAGGNLFEAVEENGGITLQNIQTEGNGTLEVTARDGSGAAITTKTFYFEAEKSTNNISSIKITKDGKEYELLTGSDHTVTMDPLHKELPVTVTSKGAVLISSDNDNIATYQNGKLLVGTNTGTAKITVHAQASGNYATEDQIFKVKVVNTATDVVSVKVDNRIIDTETEWIDLDRSDSTADNAVKSVTLNAYTLSGNSIVAYQLFSDEACKTSLSSSIAAVSSNVVTAGTVTGNAYLKITSLGSSGIDPGVAIVKIRVNSLPADIISVPDAEIHMDLKSKNTYTVRPTSSSGVAKFSYALVPDKTAGQNDGVVTVDPSGVLKAQSVGTTTLAVISSQTATTRSTVRNVKVSVVESIGLAQNVITADRNVVVLKEGDSQTISASSTAGTAVSFNMQTAGDATASVSAAGVVTGLKAGVTNVVLSAPGDSNYNSAENLVIPVVVTESVREYVVEPPEKVTGVKLANVSGAKAKVSWTQMSGVAGYRVYYWVNGGEKQYVTVSKDVISKNISVPKKASVKVKVKAFRRMPDSTAVWGTASAAVTKTMDNQ